MSKPSTDERIQDLQAQLDAHADHVRDLSSDTSIPLEARSLMAALIDTVYDLGVAVAERSEQEWASVVDELSTTAVDDLVIAMHRLAQTESLYATSRRTQHGPSARALRIIRPEQETL